MASHHLPLIEWQPLVVHIVHGHRALGLDLDLFLFAALDVEEVFMVYLLGFPLKPQLIRIQNRVESPRQHILMYRSRLVLNSRPRQGRLEVVIRNCGRSHVRGHRRLHHRAAFDHR